jgi:hypothetical protein
LLAREEKWQKIAKLFEEKARLQLIEQFFIT